MLEVTRYTNTDEIRAVIGVTDNEVSDDQLLDMLLEKRLLSELHNWLPAHAALFDTGAASGATADAENDKRNLEIYSAYYCASHINFFQLAIPNSAGDGKNAFKRFEGVDFDELSAKLRGEAEKFKDAILEEETGVPALFGISSPDYDPVTNT